MTLAFDGREGQTPEVDAAGKVASLPATDRPKPGFASKLDIAR